MCRGPKEAEDRQPGSTPVLSEILTRTAPTNYITHVACDVSYNHFRLQSPRERVTRLALEALKDLLFRKASL
jgi:hypothetical protein